MTDARIFQKEKAEELAPVPTSLSDNEIREPVEWWDGQQYPHPMDYVAFEKAFVEHVMLNGKDPDLKRWRERGYIFIRNFMSQSLEKQYNDYKEHHS